MLVYNLNNVPDIIDATTSLYNNNVLIYCIRSINATNRFLH